VKPANIFARARAERRQRALFRGHAAIIEAEEEALALKLRLIAFDGITNPKASAKSLEVAVDQAKLIHEGICAALAALDEFIDPDNPTA
jgi:hypothetical protein